MYAHVHTPQGELHPRTQQARRNYASIIDVQLSRTVTDFSNNAHLRQQARRYYCYDDDDDGDDYQNYF